MVSYAEQRSNLQMLYAYALDGGPSHLNSAAQVTALAPEQAPTNGSPLSGYSKKSLAGPGGSSDMNMASKWIMLHLRHDAPHGIAKKDLLRVTP